MTAVIAWMPAAMTAA
jgi:hypothetical protein